MIAPTITTGDLLDLLYCGSGNALCLEPASGGRLEIRVWLASYAPGPVVITSEELDKLVSPYRPSLYDLEQLLKDIQVKADRLAADMTPVKE